MVADAAHCVESTALAPEHPNVCAGPTLTTRGHGQGPRPGSCGAAPRGRARRIHTPMPLWASLTEIRPDRDAARGPGCPLGPGNPRHCPPGRALTRESPPRPVPPPARAGPGTRARSVVMLWRALRGNLAGAGARRGRRSSGSVSASCVSTDPGPATGRSASQRSSGPGPRQPDQHRGWDASPSPCRLPSHLSPAPGAPPGAQGASVPHHGPADERRSGPATPWPARRGRRGG